LNEIAALFAIISAQRIPRPNPEECVIELTESMWILMTSCWEYSADKRPSVGDVLASLTSNVMATEDTVSQVILDQPEEPPVAAEPPTASDLEETEAEPISAKKQDRLRSYSRNSRVSLGLKGTQSPLFLTSGTTILATNNTTEDTPATQLSSPTSEMSATHPYAKLPASASAPVMTVQNASIPGAPFAPDPMLNVALDDSDAALLHPLNNQYPLAPSLSQTTPTASISPSLIMNSRMRASATSSPRSLNSGVNTGYTPVSFDSVTGVDTNAFYGSYVSSLLPILAFNPDLQAD
jgi:hypothetical protein